MIGWFGWAVDSVRFGSVLVRMGARFGSSRFGLWVGLGWVVGGLVPFGLAWFCSDGWLDCWSVLVDWSHSV